MTKILCIDDDTLLMAALEKSLGVAGVEFVSFARLADFLSVGSDQAYDLALVDLNMADADGVVWKFAGMQAVKAMRARYGAALPIFIFTGQTNSYVIGSSGLNGASGYIEKFGSVEELTRQIVELADVVRTPRSGAAAESA